MCLCVCDQGRVVPDSIRRERDERHKDKVHDRWCSVEGDSEGIICFLLGHLINNMTTGWRWRISQVDDPAFFIFHKRFHQFGPIKSVLMRKVPCYLY